MLTSFSTPQLLVKLVPDATAINLNDIVKTLTKKVTAHLPQSWQSITTEGAAKQWLIERLNEGPVFQITNDDDQQLIGFLFLYEIQINDGLEIRLGYLFSEQHWGKGLASELIKGLINKCEHKNIYKVTGGVTKDNIASAKVLTKNGFVLASCEGETEFYEYRF